MPPKQQEVYLLAGLAVCAGCGAAMVRKSTCAGGKKYQYYVCPQQGDEGVQQPPYRSGQAGRNGSAVRWFVTNMAESGLSGRRRCSMARKSKKVDIVNASSLGGQAVAPVPVKTSLL